MIHVDEASRIVLSNTFKPGTEKVKIDDALNRILKEEVVADRDFPPFNRVMMDGIAIKSDEWESGRREFYIEGVQTAGAPQMALSESVNCLEVMTGAMLPQYTDVVIRYEDVEIHDNIAKVLIDEITPLQNIHLKGTDRLEGESLISNHKILSPAEIAVLATVGKAEVEVQQLIKVAIVSTGDELVSVDQTPNPYQIRRSNSHALLAALKQHGFTATIFHINDDENTLKKKLQEILNDYDAILLSGGVSKGKKDYVPAALESLKVEKLFHKVAQRPGKPFWFGKNDNTTVFALPGNPVSTFMCFYRYVLPWLYASYEIDVQPRTAQLAEDFKVVPDLTYFLQVKIKRSESGEVIAVPVSGRGSGDLANLLEADAFLELPQGKTEFKAGEVYHRIDYR